MKKVLQILMAIGVAIALVGAASAAEDGKVGKGKGPVIVQGENAVMRCPKCKTDYAVKMVKNPKGTQPEKVLVGKHLCEKCGTKLTTKGAGKGSTTVPEHTCKDCKS